MWAFDIQLLNLGGLSSQELFKKLDDRYKFAKSPKHPLDLNEKGVLAFQLGTFSNSKKKPLSVTFTIYNNGLAAETASTTDDATEFLQDLANWISREFSFQPPDEAAIKKAYFSQVTVQLDTSLAMLNPKLQEIAGMLQANLKSLDGKPRQYAFAGISFWTEDVGQTFAPAQFRLEKKWGTPLSSNQYFSQAPLQTEQHLSLISEVEKLLARN